MTRFCPGCNERFPVPEGLPVCPRCGGPAAPDLDVTDTVPTMLWRTGGDGGFDLAAELHTGEDLMYLVGRSMGAYQCETFLGRGGMGWVFLALHNQLHRSCALKLLSPRLHTVDPESEERFLNEARAAASLSHPNVITIHAVGEHDGMRFIEMEFVPGRSLQHAVSERRLTPTRATGLAVGIAAGLSAAHRNGLLHRDVKLDNVMLTHLGIPKVGDFGLAKRIVGLTPSQSPDSIAGTPNYMAPELFRGEQPTPAADVYSLGVCYYVMLTGQLPFRCGNINALMSQVHDQPLPDVRQLRPEIPLEMAECLNLLLAKSPGNRPRDAIEAGQLLQAVLGQVRDLETLLHESLGDDAGIRWQPDGHRIRIEVTLPDSRRQTVWLEDETRDTSHRLLVIYSICCPSHPGYYEEALRLNATVCHGALGIREHEGLPHFVMINAYPRATVDPEEIRRSVWEIAAHADAIERRLTGSDRN